jgi:hypothetical protein
LNKLFKIINDNAEQTRQFKKILLNPKTNSRYIVNFKKREKSTKKLKISNITKKASKLNFKLYKTTFKTHNL